MFERHRLYNINRGARLGLAMGGAAAFLMLMKNSGFIDDISDYILLFLLPPALIGAVMGLMLPSKLLGRGRPYGSHKFKTRPYFIRIVILIICVLPPAISMVKEGADGDESWSPKLMIIGMDGATWNVIRPMISSGQLPNLASLIKEGASGDLRSERPMISPALWNTIATGMPREVHGVYTFFDTSYDCKSLRFWEIMSEKKGLKFGIYRWMGTWPPPDDGLFAIPDWTARDFSTHPKELSYIQRFYNEGIQGTDLAPSKEMGLAFRMISNSMNLSDFTDLSLFNIKRLLGIALPDKERFYLNTLFRTKMDGVVARNLFERYKPDVALFSMFAPDEIGHLFWEIGPDKTGGERVKKAYRSVDEALGVLLRGIDSRTMVVVVSDHGFIEFPQAGYFDVPIVDKVIEKTGLDESVDGILVGNHIYLYIASRVETDREGKVLGELLKKIALFKMDGKTLFTSHVARGGLGVSVRIGLHKRDTIDPVCSFGTNRFPCSEILKPFEVGASHRLEGVIILKGPGVKRGANLDGASIYDVTPTLLNYVGLPVAENMPGVVLQGAFEDDWLAKHPVKYIATYPPRKISEKVGELGSSREALEERMRALGYIQ